jgi:LacI family transcriptional regulator
MAKSNKKKPTITDIASHANVSKSTVSRVLNGTTPVHDDKRKAVEDAMKEMNFEPNVFARGLASGQSLTIGLVTQNIGSPTYDSIAQGVLFSLSDSRFSPIFADGQWQPDIEMKAVETLMGRKVDGLILVGSCLPRQELDQLKEALPVMLVAQHIEDESWRGHCLYIDNEQGGYDATKHLLELGHRNIAHITGIKDQQDSIHRLNGYRRALIEAGIEIDEGLICEGQFDGNSGVMAIETLLLRGKSFSAIFAANDMMAFGARLSLYRRGIRVPEDVSVIGFDDRAEAAFATPPLTTIRQPAHEMGVAAADALVKLIDEKPYDLPVFHAEIVVRESTRVRT